MALFEGFVVPISMGLLLSAAVVGNTEGTQSWFPRDAGLTVANADGACKEHRAWRVEQVMIFELLFVGLFLAFLDRAESDNIRKWCCMNQRRGSDELIDSYGNCT
jgi:hypothetical protein